MSSYFLVFDAGSGAGRAAIVDQDFSIVATSYKEWEYYQEPDVTGGMVFSPKSFENILLKLAEKVIRKAGIQRKEIKAISATSIREGVIFLDKQGRELYAGANFDERAKKEGKLLEKKFGKKIYKTSGTYPPAYGYAARAHWFQANRPEIYEQIDCLLTMGDWLTWKLTGKKTAEPTLVSSSGVFDISNNTWSEKLCDTIQLPVKWLPAITYPGEVISTISLELAQMLGLDPDTRVVQGGGDTQCAMLGMGLVEVKQTGCAAGTTSPIQQLTPNPLFDEQMRTWTSRYLLPDMYCIESNAIITGLAVRWVRDHLTPNYDYEKMNEIMSAVPPKSNGTYAFLGAEIMDMANFQGVWSGGFIFPVPGSKSGIPELIRSVWESNAYAMRGNVEQIEEISGNEVQELHICGGQTASDIGMKIYADVLGIPMIVHDEQATLKGAAICAALGTGEHGDFQEVLNNFNSLGTTITPSVELHKIYENGYSQWRDYYDLLKNKQKQKEIIC